MEGGFVDMVWPQVCLVEMKRPSEANRLEIHRDQARGYYWERLGRPDSSAPRYMVLCAFSKFEVWEPGAVYTEPLVTLELTELPDRLEVLQLLAGRDAVFTGTQAELTSEAVGCVTRLYDSIAERRGADRDTLRDFILQSVWCMFAEDLQMIPGRLFTRLCDQLVTDANRSSADELGRLFRYLADREPRPPAKGAYAGTPYADGGLFQRPAEVHLEDEEIHALRTACDFDWKRVEPAIFGSLLEGTLGRERQWHLGAHYTAEADIMKAVLPTVVEPWRERIEACASLDDLRRAQSDLMSYVVLDPACGSGNFLYVAYRELRRIEADLRHRVSQARRGSGLRDQEALALFPLENMRGIEIDSFAVKLARVTLGRSMRIGSRANSGSASRITASTGSVGPTTIWRMASALDLSEPTQSRRIGRAGRASSTSLTTAA